jgi:type IV pilus assembly protein PilO
MSSQVLDDETLRFGRLLHYAGLAVVLICGAIAHSYWYEPVEIKILDTQMKIEELAISRQNADVIRREHARLTSQLREIEVRYAALEERVPLNSESGQFLKHVSEIAQEEELVISNFQPGETITGDGYTALEVLLEGKGTFAGICSFFDRLSKIQRLSKVKDLTLGIGQGDEGYPMQATIVIYFGLQGETAAQAAEVRRG